MDFARLHEQISRKNPLSSLTTLHNISISNQQRETGNLQILMNVETKRSTEAQTAGSGDERRSTDARGG